MKVAFVAWLRIALASGLHAQQRGRALGSELSFVFLSQLVLLYLP